MSYEHSPLSKSPLRIFFEEIRTIEGSRRTVSIACFFFHKDPYNVKFGPIIRIIHDMGDEEKVWGSMDTGTE